MPRRASTHATSMGSIARHDSRLAGGDVNSRTRPAGCWIGSGAAAIARWSAGPDSRCAPWNWMASTCRADPTIIPPCKARPRTRQMRSGPPRQHSATTLRLPSFGAHWPRTCHCSVSAAAHGGWQWSWAWRTPIVAPHLTVPRGQFKDFPSRTPPGERQASAIRLPTAACQASARCAGRPGCSTDGAPILMGPARSSQVADTATQFRPWILAA